MPRSGSGGSLGVWNPVVFPDVRQKKTLFFTKSIYE